MNELVLLRNQVEATNTEISRLKIERDAYAAAADTMAAAHKVERDALKDAARLALDALKRVLYKDSGEPVFFEVREAINALKAVL